MNIGVDIDGIIADADSEFRKRMKEVFKRDFCRADVKTFRYEECFEFSAHEFKSLCEMFVDDDIWSSMKPIEGAKEALIELSKKNRIIIATARPHEVKRTTIAWLKEHGICYDEIHFTLTQKHLVLENLDCKLDFFIEDHPDFARRIADLGIKVIIFAYPWNDAICNHKDIKRLAGWQEALAYLKNHDKR